MLRTRLLIIVLCHTLNAQTATYRHHGPAVLNDLAATPGAVGTLPQATLCSPSFHTATVRNVTMAVKYQVCAAYGISRANCNGRTYEIDHLISLELGGSNDPANLWPQPYFPHPGAKEKDVVENYLHRQVCSGKMTLADAQQSISNDWYQVYLDVTTPESLRAVEGRRAGQHLDTVVTNVADERVRGRGLHGLGLIGPKKVARSRTRVVSVEPLLEVARMQDHGHPGVDLGHQLVGFSGDDREGLQPFIRAGLPCVPQAGEGKGLAISQAEGEGLLVRFLAAFRAGRSQPLVKAVDRHKTAAALEGTAPCRGGQVLGLRVDRAEALEGIQRLGKEGDQAPAHQDEFTVGRLALLANHGLEGAGRDVVVGRKREIPQLAGAKPLGDLLLVGLPIVAPTHGDSLSPAQSYGLPNDLQEERDGN